MFKSVYEAKNAFEELLRRVSRQTSRSAENVPRGIITTAVWTIAEGYTPTRLEIKVHNIGGTLFIGLRCGNYRNIVGAEEGQWDYFCSGAIGDYKCAGAPLKTVFDTMEELEAALRADIEMYLDGSYKTLDIRPRSHIKVA